MACLASVIGGNAYAANLGKRSLLVAGHFESELAPGVYVIMLFENDGIESPLCRITVGYV